MAGCYGPLSGIYCINESADSMPVFRASVKKFFRPVRKVSNRMHSGVRAPGHPPSRPQRWESRGCQNRPRFGAEEPPKRTRSAFKIARTMHQKCTRGAFRRLHAPYKPDHRRLKGVIPAEVGTQGVSKTGPDSVQNAPETHPQCIQTCTNDAPNVHSWRPSKTPRHPARSTTMMGKTRLPPSRE